MRHHLRFVVTLVIALLAYAVLIRAFHLISAPSDQALYAGLGIVLALILIVPAVVYAVWRKL
jgi:hypothetical protein